MDTNEEVRRRRLKQLCDANGGVRAVAAKADMHWQSLDQVIKRVLLPKKADGTQSPRALGDAAARDLERAFGLGEGWLDWPFEHADFEQWAALDSFQRAFVEGQLSLALREAAEKMVPAHLRQQAVTDRKVEAHFPALPPGAAKAAYERAAKQERSSVRVPRDDDLFAGRDEDQDEG